MDEMRINNMEHIIVSYDKNKWNAVPANNGSNGPYWQWGNEILTGYTSGVAQFIEPGHQVDDIHPLASYLAKSTDGGMSWKTWRPDNYPGCERTYTNELQNLKESLDFKSSGFVFRIEGNGYHGNSGCRWFYSMDKGQNWNGPHSFGSLMSHPELAGKEFTGRTAYLINSSKECFFFLSERNSTSKSEGISLTDKVFLAKSTDGGLTFEFVSWIVPPSDPYRAVMPAPVRISENDLIVSVRRKDKDGNCWIDCYSSDDDGNTWNYLSFVGKTGASNGNPPAMVKMTDGRLCCVYGNRDKRQMLAVYSSDKAKTWSDELVLRDGFESRNGWADLGYPRLFQRPDGRLVAIYFWCSAKKPETHIEATIFK